MTSNQIPRGRTAWRWGAGIVVLAIAAGAAALVARGGAVKSAADTGLTYVVERKPLTISVSESGTIKARQQEIIKSEVEGQSTILYLMAEGTRVKKGELLIELDASKLQDQRVDKQIAVQNAEANFISSREKLEVARNQAEADVAKAKLDAKFAEDDLKKYIEGDSPKEMMEAQSKIDLADEELIRANDKVEGSRKLFAEKYISGTELQADELSAKKAKLEVKLAQESLKLLKDYSYVRRIEELKSNVDQTKMALERTTRKAAADVVQAEADLKAKQSEFDRQKSQLAKLDQQITKAKVYAPMDGMVVYASTAQGGFRGNSEPLAEGQTVRERQDLIYLPTATDMMAEVKVHESSLDKVRLGLPVRVTVDAVPGQTFTGRLARIAPLPDAQSSWLNPDMKVYSTEIHLDGDGSALRTGMNCRAEIIVDYYPEAVQVPVQSVVRVKGKPTVYVRNGDEARPVGVDLGMDNNRMAHIRSGLEPGQQVLLTPPLTDAEQITAVPTELSDTEKQMTQQQPTPTTRPRGGGRRADAAGAGNGTADPGSAAPTSRPAMSSEDRQRMSERFQNMTPEEREKAVQQFRSRGRGGQGAPGGQAAPGGQDPARVQGAAGQ